MTSQCTAHYVICRKKKKKARRRCCWNCNIWAKWLTYHQSHYCLYYNGIPEFVRKRSMLNVVQYLKFHCQKVESTRNGKLRRLSGRFQTVPGSQIAGKTRKWGRGGKKGKTRGERACNHFFYDPLPPPPPLPSFLQFFFFALSQFRGPDYPGAWNRLTLSCSSRSRLLIGSW